MIPETVTNKTEVKITPHLYNLDNTALIQEALSLSQLKVGMKGQEVISFPISKLVKHPSWETRRVSKKSRASAQEMLEAHPEITSSIDPMVLSQLPETLGKLHAARQRSLSSLVCWLAHPTRGYITTDYVDQETGKLKIAELEEIPYFKLENNHPLLEALKDFQVGKRSRLMKVSAVLVEGKTQPETQVQSFDNKPFSPFPEPLLVQNSYNQPPSYSPSLWEKIIYKKNRITDSIIYQNVIITAITCGVATATSLTVPHLFGR